MRRTIDYLLLASGTGTEILASAIVTFVQLMMFEPLLFNLTITGGFVLNKIISALVVFVFMTI